MSSIFAVVDAKSVTGTPTLILAAVPPFVYGLPWGLDTPWSDGAVLRIVSDDGSETHEFQKSDGTPAGDFIVFTFTKSRPTISYRGTIVDGDSEFQLFGAVELWRVQDPADPSNHLPLPAPAATGDSGDSAATDSSASGDSAATSPSGPSDGGDSTAAAPSDPAASGDSAPTTPSSPSDGGDSTAGTQADSSSNDSNN